MRKTYIDNIRWITVMIVLIYHVIYMFNGVTTFGVMGPFSENQPQDIFLYIVYPWFMLLLFVVSGMSARYELDRVSAKEFIRKRTRKLLVPSTVGLFVWGWILGYYNMMIGGSFDTLSQVPKPILFAIMCVSGTGPLWYIQMLWLFSVVLVWIRKLEKDRFWRLCQKSGVVVALMLTIVVFGAAQILNTPVVTVYRFGIYGAGFLIGYFVFSHDEVMERLEKSWILLGVLAFISCVAFTVMYYGQSYPDAEVLKTPVCNIFAWLGTIGVLSFMKKWGGFNGSFSRWMSKQSWGLYVFHYLPLAMCAWYLKQYAPGMPVICMYLLTFAATFGGAVLMHFVISKVPVIRWCVLGYRKEKNELRR